MTKQDLQALDNAILDVLDAEYGRKTEDICYLLAKSTPTDAGYEVKRDLVYRRCQRLVEQGKALRDQYSYGGVRYYSNDAEKRRKAKKRKQENERMAEEVRSILTRLGYFWGEEDVERIYREKVEAHTALGYELDEDSAAEFRESAEDKVEEVNSRLHKYGFEVRFTNEQFLKLVEDIKTKL